MACRTCDGKCCSVFTFDNNLSARADRIADPQAEWYEDDRILLEMLNPLTTEEARERAERYGVTMGDEPGEGRAFFSCRLWDEETGLCTRYEERPRMCRCYPYGRGCDHGCDYEVPAELLVKEKWVRYAFC